jgi:DNA polymerase III epsilon subunit-like protein
MQDIMIDLETLGTRPGSIITSIGAVAMDLENGIIGDRDSSFVFHRRIDPISSQGYGLTMDADTVVWWSQQSDEARQELQGKEFLGDVLYDFSKWLHSVTGGYSETRIWGNGATFDNVLLRAAYAKVGGSAPWPHTGDRCYRTMKALTRGVELKRTGTHHNALDDAISQAEHLVRIMRHIMGAL